MVKKGFTLIELLIVIAIIGVLAAAVIVAINPAKRIAQANDATIKSDIGSIATAEQAYFTGNQGMYPIDVHSLVDSKDLKQEPKAPLTGSSYKVCRTAACAADDKTGCEVAVYAPMNDVTTAGDVWCYKSATNTASELTAAACTTGMTGCP